MNERTTRVKDSYALEERINDLQVNGYKLREQEDDRARLVYRSNGSAIVHIFVFLFTFWTFGIANLFVAWIARIRSEDKVTVVIDPVEEDGDAGETPEDGADAEESGR